MADDVILNPGTGGAQMATKDDGTRHHQKILNEFIDEQAQPREVTNRVGLPIALADDHHGDAFHRLRVSSPTTIFDSKQLHDNQPLFWDDQQVSGTGTGSTHDTDTASSVMTVGATTAGSRVRQTFQRFNYQPGKSQLVMLTGTMGAAATGITRRIGVYDSNDGLFFNQEGATLSVTIRSSVTGSPVDLDVPQASWNLDTFDGNGPSGVTLDLTKSQIFVIDYQWLGSGRVRFGFEVGGETIYVHENLRANLAVNPYMSTPNLPLRFEITNDGTGAASTLIHTCCSIITEGGVERGGVTRLLSSGSVGISAPTAGTIYAVKGVRLKSTHLDEQTIVESAAAFLSSGVNDMGEWFLVFDPVVAGTFTYTAVANSSFEEATGATANTVTEGTIVDGGFLAPARQGAAALKRVPSSLGLGSYIDGTPNAIVLCYRPITGSSVVHGQLLLRGLS